MQQTECTRQHATRSKRHAALRQQATQSTRRSTCKHYTWNLQGDETPTAAWRRKQPSACKMQHATRKTDRMQQTAHTLHQVACRMQHCNMLLQHDETDAMQHAKQTACIKQRFNMLLQSATCSISTRNNARAACNSRHGTMAACNTEAAASITEHQCVYGARDARDTQTCTMHASYTNANGVKSLQHAPCKMKHAACNL